MSGPTLPAAAGPLGVKSGAMLLTLFQDVYRQELGAEEDVHRTLPFFAAALGFIIAAINYAVGQLPNLDALTRTYPWSEGGLLNHHALARSWPVMLAMLLLVLAAALGLGVLGFLAAATQRLRYQRAGPEPTQLLRAEELQGYYAALGLSDTALDDAVSLDLRQQLLDNFAVVISHSRQLTLQRYQHRARAVSCLLLSLLFALLATTLVLVAGKTGLLLKA